jgi:ABC-type dipeptide/oligopeptide/nickel transport system permease subunit
MNRGNEMKKSSETGDPEKERLFSGVLWLNAKAMGLAFGLICALIIFIATNWLVLKGGNTVGPNLGLLSQYFIGYRVSFVGSLIGSAYGFALGTLCGALIGWIYNKVASLGK